jgi:hypothetical protein
MNGLLQPAQDLARGAICAMHAALRRGARVGLALLIALPGAAFLLVAAFLGLRTLLGAGLAALILGLSLLAVAAGVLLVGRGAVPSLPAPPLWTAPPVAAPRPADLATMTVFTTAFMLGRRLAERPRRSNKP